MSSKSDGIIRVSVKLDTTDVPGELKDMEKMIMRTAENMGKMSDVTMNVNGGEEAVKTFENTLHDIEKIADVTVGIDVDDTALDALVKRAVENEKNPKNGIIFGGNDDYVEFNASEKQRAAMAEEAKQKAIEANQYIDSFEKKLEKAAETAKKAEITKKEKADVKAANAEASDWAAGASFTDKIKNMRQYKAAVEATQRRISELEAAAQRAADAKGVDVKSVLAANKEYQKTTARLKVLTSAETKHKVAAKSAWNTSKNGAEGFASSIKGAIKQMSKYTLAIFGARSAFMAVKGSMQQYISDNESLSRTIESMKGVLGEMTGPVIEYIVGVLKEALAYANLFIKALTGVDFVARYNAKQLEKHAKAIRKNTEEHKEFNKAQLASFDTLERLDDLNQANSGKEQFDDFQPLELPDVSGSAFEKFANDVKKNIKEILLGGGLILVGIGAALAFSGANIPLGLAMIIAGAAAVYKAVGMYWNELSNSTKKVILEIADIVSKFLVAIGLVLLCCGQIAIGVSLIIAGILLNQVKDYEEIKLNPDAALDEVKDAFGVLLEYISDALVVLGIIAIVAGQIPLGAGLIIAGIIAGEIAYKKYDAKESIFGTVKRIIEEIKKDITGFFDWFGRALKANTGEEKFNVVKEAFSNVVDWLKRKWDWFTSYVLHMDGFITPSVSVGSSSVKAGNAKTAKTATMPRLARGGIVNNPGRGVNVTAGERGREAVLPLENYTEWMDVLAEKIALMMNSSPQTLNVRATGSLAQLVRLLRLEIEKDERAATAWR